MSKGKIWVLFLKPRIKFVKAEAKGHKVEDVPKIPMKIIFELLRKMDVLSMPMMRIGDPSLAFVFTSYFDGGKFLEFSMFWDKANKCLSIIDSGIGMTKVDKYSNFIITQGADRPGVCQLEEKPKMESKGKFNASPTKEQKMRVLSVEVAFGRREEEKGEEEKKERAGRS
eukprot:Gb_05503 [translate_table: standard]